MLQDINMGTDMEDLIREVGYAEIRDLFIDEIEEEINKAYERGISFVESKLI